jgi:hypothetical protein
MRGKFIEFAQTEVIQPYLSLLDRLARRKKNSFLYLFIVKVVPRELWAALCCLGYFRMPKVRISLNSPQSFTLLLISIKSVDLPLLSPKKKIFALCHINSLILDHLLSFEMAE